MSALKTEARLGAEADILYVELVDLFRQIDDEAARLAAAKLILLLANHIGDPAVVRAAIEEVRSTASPPSA
jgi:hypothetical protein